LALSFPLNTAASVTPTRCRREHRDRGTEPSGIRRYAFRHRGGPGRLALALRQPERDQPVGRAEHHRPVRALRDWVARLTRDARPQRATFPVDVAAKATIFPCCVPTLPTWVCRDWPRAIPLGPSTLEVMDRPHPLFDQLGCGGLPWGLDRSNGGGRGYFRTRMLWC